MRKTHPNLQLRGSVWCFRKRTPNALRSLLPTEIVSSLGTKDKREALRLLPVKQLAADELFERTRASLARQIGVETSAKVPDEDEAIDLVQKWFASALRYYEETDLDGFEQRDRLPAYAFHHLDKRHSLEGPRGLVDYILQSNGFATWPTHRFIVDADGNRRFKKGGVPPAVILFMRDYAYEAMQEAKKRFLLRIEPAVPQELNPSLSSVGRGSSNGAVRRTKFASLVSNHRKAADFGVLSKKTIKKHAAQDALIIEVIGKDRPVSSIDRSDARNLKSLLSILPANYKKRFPQKRANDFVDMEPALRGPPMAAITANGYMATFYAVLSFGDEQGLLEKMPVKLAPIRETRVKDERRSFKLNELASVFNAPIYTGCIDDERNYRREGLNRPRRHRFWVPLLLCFSGARANEMCQLTCDDITTEEGVHIFDLRFDEARGKRLKNKQSRRRVPIHSNIVELGFLEYVDNARRKNGPMSFLFPDIPLGSMGYRSDHMSRWFARFLSSLGLDDPTLVLHSLRHTFRDALREGGVHRERADAIAGWTSGDGTGDAYGDGFRPAILAQDMEKACFRGLNLDHLRP